MKALAIRRYKAPMEIMTLPPEPGPAPSASSPSSLGARVATTASATNHALVKSLGADIAIDYKTTRFEAESGRAVGKVVIRVAD
jgi:hypothetical protein